MESPHVNPFFGRRPEYAVFEILKDGLWHSEDSILKALAEQAFPKGSKGRAFDKIVPAGKEPVAKYPLGRWILERRHGNARLVFVEPVAEGTGIDEEALKQIVSTQIDASVVGKVQDLVKDATDEQVKLIAAQIQKMQEEAAAKLEEIKKSSVPVLELVQYTENGKKQTKVVQPAHEMMPELMYYLALRDHVYLYDGPGDSGPGSGKSTAAIMAAAALKLGKGWDIVNPITKKKEKVHFGYISLEPTTSRAMLFGYQTADGKYIRTDFRNCYEFGGVFLIDEGDNGSSNLYTSLNGAFENNYCAFPDKIVKRHPDFVVVMTGNTSGGGPNPMFPTRRPFDKAFQERFTYIGWNYDNQLERVVATAINPVVAPIWHEYILKLRAYCKKHYPMVVVSPRATFKGAKYMKDGVIKMERMIDGIIFKGYDKDSVASILSANPVPYDELKNAILEYQKQGGERRVKKGARNVN